MEELNIKTLLQKYRLVIPEIQREYVWGAEENQEKLKRFLEDLNDEIQSKKNVGFLYSYLVPDLSHYLIDGQQRFTTIILLLYVLSIKEGRCQEFRNLLQVEQPSMKFSYNVRPMTEQFMRSLFTDTKDLSSVIIKDRIWYIQAYNSDKTIASMLNAIDVISGLKIENLSFDAILNNVQFWYFDVKQTSQGEELYITMNSRGRKLVNYEQIKPLLFEQVNPSMQYLMGKEWDDMEEFFFNHRIINKDVENDDIALNNFLQCVIEIELHTSVDKIDDINHSKVIKLEKLLTSFRHLKFLYKNGIINETILRALYKQERKAQFIYTLEALLIIYPQLIGNNETFSKEQLRTFYAIIRIISNTLQYYPNTGSEQFHKGLANILQEYKVEESWSIYDFLVKNKDKVVRRMNGKQLDGFIPNREFEKIEAIALNIIPEQDIIDAEKIAFFKGRIHFMYHNSTGDCDWNDFYKKKELCELRFEEKGLKHDEHKKLLKAFIGKFDEWSLFWNCQFDNTEKAWEKYLMDAKWQKPIHFLLTGDIAYNENYKSSLEDPLQAQVQNDLVTTTLLNDIVDGCDLHWYAEKYALYPYNVKADRKKYVIADVRNKVLSSLAKQKVIEMRPGRECQSMPSDFFWGWNICFTYRGRYFYWGLWDKIHLVGKDWKPFMLEEKNVTYSVTQTITEMETISLLDDMIALYPQIV